jgi:glucose-6-phosphate 1-dehydrogenase
VEAQIRAAQSARERSSGSGPERHSGGTAKRWPCTSGPFLTLPFGHSGEALPNVLRFGLDPESLTLDLTGIAARAHTFVPLQLTAGIEPPELPAYGRLLLDVLNGNPALSIRADEAEEAWRVVAPVLSAWSKALVPLLEYPAGSQGPGSRQHQHHGPDSRESAAASR